MFHTLHCPRCRAWLYCPGRVGASAVQPPGPVATIRPRAPRGALARGGREWAVPPRTPKVGTLWAVGGSPHHRPRDPSGGNRATLTPPGRRVAGSPPTGVPKPAASARARDPGLTLEGGTRTLTPGPAAAGGGPRARRPRAPAGS
ncbi:hypothetical protein GQ602_004633 [Ophiocordyceps camponoti-floridani]|uniref:Uncharacterized protein n=1 Tax=Ophiocordyceps camponoti-floridani TaxID=2030778 RepID=A0A8H4Q458_9HYPO|nr:hypothetical protein GQ602_004633 [Ophiocordyceps camponoti-floridani]